MRTALAIEALIMMLGYLCDVEGRLYIDMYVDMQG